MNVKNKFCAQTFLIFIFLLLIGTSVRAQQATPCPTVYVSSSDSVAAGEPLTFSANVSGGDPNVTPTYNWTISASTIESGQGTASITVDTTGAGDQTITATVDVGGYDRSCSTSNSSTTAVMKKSEARKFDEYGKIRLADEKTRLDNFAVEMQSDPTAQGYIIVYGGRTSAPGAAQKSANRAKTYLVKKRGIAAERVVVVDGGYREDSSTELFVVPTGATPPDASPTIDPSEVKSPAKKKTNPAKKS